MLRVHVFPSKADSFGTESPAARPRQMNCSDGLRTACCSSITCDLIGNVLQAPPLSISRDHIADPQHEVALVAITSDQVVNKLPELVKLVLSGQSRMEGMPPQIVMRSANAARISSRLQRVMG